MLAVTDVSAGYGGGTVLHGVGLDCAAGTVTCVIGPNGAGKSTVLRVVGGLLRPSAGRVLLDGADIGGLPPPEVLRRGVATVPQTQALFPAMTVRENVLMGGFTIRRDRALLRARYAAVAERVPLVAARAGERAGNLSGGQRRLVEIARCLMLDPRVLLLDEPSVGLDPRALTAVTELITGLHTDGRTLLLIEQNVRLGLRLATHAAVMESGRVVLRGTATEVAEHPGIADLYLGGRTAAPDSVGRTDG